MPEPTLPDDDLMRTARTYLAHLGGQTPPRTLEEDAMTYALSRRRRFSLAALLGGGAVVVVAGAAAAVALAYHAPPSAALPAGPPAASASATPTPLVTTSPSAPAISAVPASTVLIVPQFGFQLSLPAGISDATYRVDRASAGTFTDANGRAYTVAGLVTLSTRTIAADKGCAGAGGTTWNPASIEVLTTDPTHLVLASGPSRYRHVGRYWLGYLSPQYTPTGAQGTPSCAQATMSIHLFSTAFDSARAT